MSARYRGPQARHTKLRRPSVIGRFFKGIALALSAVLVAGLGVGAYAYHEYFGTLADNSVTLAGQEVNPPDVKVLPNQELNILVAGIDKCEIDRVDLFEGRCTEAEAEAHASFVAKLGDDAIWNRFAGA